MEKKRKVPHRVLQQVLTVPEVAAMKGVDQTTVTRSLKSGELPGEQRSRFWIIARPDAEAWQPTRPRRGRGQAQ